MTLDYIVGSGLELIKVKVRFFGWITSSSQVITFGEKEVSGKANFWHKLTSFALFLPTYFLYNVSWRIISKILEKKLVRVYSLLKLNWKILKPQAEKLHTDN